MKSRTVWVFVGSVWGLVVCAVLAFQIWYHCTGEWWYIDYYDRFFVSFSTLRTKDSYDNAQFCCMEVMNRHYSGDGEQNRIPQSCGVVINHNGESIRAADITHRHLKAWGIEDIHTYPPNYTIYTVPNLGDFIFKGDYVAEIRLVVGANATIMKGEPYSLPIAVCDIRAMLGKPEVHAGHREPVFWIGP